MSNERRNPYVDGEEDDLSGVTCVKGKNKLINDVYTIIHNSTCYDP